VGCGAQPVYNCAFSFAFFTDLLASPCELWCTGCVGRQDLAYASIVRQRASTTLEGGAEHSHAGPEGSARACAHTHVHITVSNAGIWAASTRSAGRRHRAWSHVSRGQRSRLRACRVLGSEHVQRWEVLWSKSTYALKAARSLRPGQQISAIVGLNTLTMKKRMLQTLKVRFDGMLTMAQRTLQMLKVRFDGMLTIKKCMLETLGVRASPLQAALGDQGAWRITPVSFALPEEMDEWRAWAAVGRAMGSAAHPAVGSHAGGWAEGWVQASMEHHSQQQQQQQQQHQHPDQEGRPGFGLDTDELWILKTGQDAGEPQILQD